MAHDNQKVSIQLTVADLETTEAFYAGILEMPIRHALTAPGAPEHLLMKMDGWELIFVDESEVIQNHPVLEERLQEIPKGVGMTLHFPVEDIEGIFAALVEEEIEILYPLQVMPYGMKEVWCFDPDGYLLVLEEPVRRKVQGEK
ncbi:MAG: VOC family protein [Geobacter sp.]|nr:VOC family protein [Geobacter sp.]